MSEPSTFLVGISLFSLCLNVLLMLRSITFTGVLELEYTRKNEYLSKFTQKRGGCVFGACVN